jgi:hypothetical protein
MTDTAIQAKSPLGYEVVCTKAHWNDILSPVGHGHGDMTGREDSVIAAIERPKYIYASIAPIGRHIYFSHPTIAGSGKTAYTKAIITPPETAGACGGIVTAHRTQRIDANRGSVIYDATKV